jgi:hypothetical protein
LSSLEFREIMSGALPLRPQDLALSGQTDPGARGGCNRPASPHSRQRSGRIPALPYPLREHSDFSEGLVV